MKKRDKRSRPSPEKKKRGGDRAGGRHDVLRLDQLFQVIPDLCFLIDGAGRFLDYRAGKGSVLFRPPGSFLGKLLADVLPADIASLFLDKIRAAAAAKKLIRFEYGLAMPGGARRYECRLKRIERADRFLAIVRDVTHEHQIEQSLIESEVNFKLLAESAPEAVFIQVRKRFAYVNQACVKLYGARSADELLGTPVMDRFHPDYHAAIAERIRGLNELDRDAPPMEQRHVTLAGGVIDVETAAVPFFFKGESGALVFVKDITGRKKADRLIRESEARLRLFIEHAPASLAMFDRGMCYLAHSRRWLDDYGLGERDLAGLSHYDVFPEIGDDLKAVHRRAMAGEVVRKDDDRFDRADGNVQWLRWEVRPWYAADGAIGGIVVFSEDITERKNAELALGRERLALGERIKELRCLYDVLTMTEDLAAPLETVLRKVAERMPAAWRYPETAVARVDFGGSSFRSPGFVESPWMLRAEGTTEDGRKIVLSVGYRDEPPAGGEGLFLEEERVLLAAVVRRLTDVIDRRRTAEELRETIERYRIISEHSGDVIWILDPARMRFTYVSPSVRKMRGYSPEEVMAEPAEKAMTPESWLAVRGKMEAQRDAIRAGDEAARAITVEIEQPRRDGSVIPTEAVVTFLTDERREIMRIIGVTRDVSERREQEEALRASEEKYRTVADYTYDWETWRDERNGYRYVSPSCERITGYAAAEFLENPRFLLDIVHPEDAPLAREHFGSFPKDRNNCTFDFRIVTRDGDVRWINHFCRPILDKGGKTIARRGSNRDVTERVRAEVALAFKSAVLEAQSETSPNGIWAANSDRRIILSNERLEELTGAPPELLENKDDALLQEFVASLMKDPRCYLETVERLYAGHSKMSREELALADGRAFDLYSAPLIGADSTYYGRIWYVTDVTERKRMLEELSAHRHHLEELVAVRTAELAATLDKLRLSEERFALALDATTDGLWDWDLTTDESYCSPSYFRMLGYEPGELGSGMRERFADLIHPEDREGIVELARRRLAESGGYELEFRMRAKSGEYKWIVSRGKVVRRDESGRPLRAVGTHTDLSVRKRLEIELRNAAAEQQAVFDSAPVGIVLLKDRRVLRCNRKVELIFGYAPGAFDGVPAGDWFGEREAFEDCCAAFEKALAAGDNFSAEYQLMRRDGTRFWARISARAIDAADPEKPVIVTFEDITAERDAAEALRAAKEAAELANRSKSDFLANMSHEIRTPMNAVIGFSRLLLNTGLSDEQRGYLARITASGDHLIGIINDILDLSKIEAGKLVLERTPFDLERVFAGLADFLNEKAGAKDIEIVFDISPAVPRRLVGDSLRLTQVLLNYCANAVKFTERGEICVSALVRERTPAGAAVRFQVRDTGIGLTPEQKSRLFRSFEQADMSTTRRYGGTGLGLVISRRLAESMGGETGVESEYGRGSTFWFTARFGVDPGEERLLVPEPGLRGSRVLVADDSESARSALSETLASMGFRVTAVPSGEAALDAAARAGGDPFRIAILDWKMPGWDGVETARRLPRSRGGGIFRIILVTAYDREEARRAAAGAGIDEVLVKPVTPSTLFDAIVRRLGGSPPEAVASGPGERTRSAGIAGASVLLVEDNELNRELAVGLLTAAGLRVETAGNGREALDLAARGGFDLVLMDVQMPVMDGLEAAREFRRDPRFAGLPVVAMTANAMPQDRAACLEAGMVDYVPKPIDPGFLLETLGRWIRPRVSAAGAPPDLAENKTAAELPERIAGIDLEDGLRRFLGKKDRYAGLLRRFCARRRGAAGEIGRALDAGDRETAERIAHTVKGTAGNLGAKELQARAEELERAIRKGGGPETTSRPLADFGKTLAALLAEIERALPAASAAPEAAEDPAALAGAATALERALRESDAAAVDVFEAHRGLFRNSFPDRAEALERAITDYDFDGALALLAHGTGGKPSDRSAPRGGDATDGGG